MRRVLHLDARDNVLIALADLEAGEQAGCTLVSGVPAKHKFALRDLAPGDAVIMYGVLVGRARRPVRSGELLSTANVTHDAAPYAVSTGKFRWMPPDISHWSQGTFGGYRRRNGQVGTRNYWIVLPLVFCENRNLAVLQEAFHEELGFAPPQVHRRHVADLVKLYREGRIQDIRQYVFGHSTDTSEPARVFPHVDGIKFLSHEMGCGGTREDSNNLCGLLAGYICHPNVFGATVLSLGCQHAQVEILRAELKRRDPSFSKPLFVFEQQQFHSESEMLDQAIRQTFVGLVEANQANREDVPLSGLRVGLKCGGSDGFSGISANPVVGHVADLVVGCGGAAILSEFPELCGVEQDLIDRSARPEIAARFIELMRDYAARAKAVRSGFEMNPSPGNIREGLITDAMKSAGAARKGGTSPVTAVLDYPEWVTEPGLNLLCTPGNDVECVTAQVAAGANLVLFTTGLGTPTGNPIAPVVKISSNSAAAGRMGDIIDFDAGPVINRRLHHRGIRKSALGLCAACGQRRGADEIGIIEPGQLHSVEARRFVMKLSRSRRLWIAALVFAAAVVAQRRTIPESHSPLLYAPTYDECLRSHKPVVTRKDIYHEGWIDLNKNGRRDVYEDSTQLEEKRLDDLIRQMTVEEKTVQLATLYGYRRVLGDYLPTEAWRSALWKDGVANIDEHLNGYPYEGENVPGAAFLWPASKHTWALNEVQRFFIEETRLGIPAEFTNEGIRGIEHTKATAFPTQLGQGPTWDRELIRKIGEITGQEAYALGYDNVYAPVLDVMRDPRWGRCLESYGEDPFLVSELGIEMVRGLQSQRVAATLKHFAVYANNKGAREGNARTDPQIAPREMEMLHLWPYERVMRAANPLGVMSSYNDYDGVPITGSRYFLTDILRGRMGFQGYVVSDSAAVENLFRRHHVAADPKDAVRLAVLAGLNVRTEFSPPEDYVLPLRELVHEGAVPNALLDARVRDVLRVKMREGLFDKPYRSLDVDSVVMSPENLAVARRASRESVVLLKNERNLLPLDGSKIKTIAVSGPNAANIYYSLGRYGPGDVPVITVRQALENRFAGQGRVLYSLGADFFDEKWPDTEIFHDPPSQKEQRLIDEAVAQARQADLAVVVVGDQFSGRPDVRGTVGESASRTSLDLTGRQDDLIRAIAATGKPMVVVDISGRPVALNVANRLAPAIVQAFMPGMFGGEAIADVLFGDYNPGGKLTATFPKTTGQLELNFPAKPAANTEESGRLHLSITGILWPFGYGLSYTTFRYADLRISPARATPQTNVTVSFNVTNTGTREGDEIPQLYIHQEVSSTTTWDQALRGFDRIHLRPGETKTVTWTVSPDLLAIWNLEMKRVVEPGKFDVQVGASSADIRLRGQFEILR